MRLSLITKYVYYFIITLIILSLGITSYFLYENFYGSLVQARVVYVLKSQVAFKVVDIYLWNKVQRAFENKKTLKIEEGAIIPDPFSPLIEVTE